MQYFLDFDRTVFDMEGLYQAISETNPTARLGTVESLEGVDLSLLLFQDAMDFFASHEKDSVNILSSGHGKTGTWDPEYQAEKIRRSGVATFVNDVHIVAKDKVATLQKAVIESNDLIVFVDDHLDNVKEVNRELPEVKTVYLDRQEELAEVGDVSRIVSLNELDAIIEA